MSYVETNEIFQRLYVAALVACGFVLMACGCGVWGFVVAIVVNFGLTSFAAGLAQNPNTKN